jgi:ABC-type lipoprotein release transport system permease subunit
VIGLVLKNGLQLRLGGLVIGRAGAIGLSRLLASLLFEVQPADALTMLAVVATIGLTATVASWLPAWRASRVDPMVALRPE